jgi:Na+-transporting NADH:ubiquinone oxidoreductase subunit NqrB
MGIQSYLFQIWQSDPRHYQITVQSSLLVYGIFWLDFEMELEGVVTIISTAWLTQLLCTRLFKLPRFDFRSPLSSALSLCLLLRANTLLLMGIAAAITILSKFIFRWKNKHLFNPSCFGIVVMILLTGQVWVSPGQWGSVAIFAFLIAGLGGLVINRAARSDVTLAFLFFYSSLLFGRALWLGDPLTIPLHQLENGALILFSFFMISDPKTTPNSRLGRILFAFLIAMGAGFVYFGLYRTNGVFYSLAFFALFVPLIDWLLPGKRYQWKTADLVSPSVKG